MSCLEEWTRDAGIIFSKYRNALIMPSHLHCLSDEKRRHVSDDIPPHELITTIITTVIHPTCLSSPLPYQHLKHYYPHHPVPSLPTSPTAISLPPLLVSPSLPPWEQDNDEWLN
ncbi:hypothetical protein E2C01_039496 [Portunus trituberculatus]|uniref:Uncharacterized protein n=1 Tax=Portunus trituberculatus TaxID=210409 RepID=A0A5B7FEW1_PORTR|nr:hypothetical protein [Portunus trituberculatus]